MQKLTILLASLIGSSQAQAPTASPTPSPSVTFVPTLRQPKISDPIAEVTINDNHSQILLSYVTSDLDYQAAIYDLTCNTSIPIAETSIVLNATANSTDNDFSGDSKAITLDLDLKPSGLANDPSIYNDTNPEETTVGFCVRVGLLFNDAFFGETNPDIVVFHNTKVRVIANTTVSFEVTNIQLEIEDPTNVNKTVDFTYDINAYQCDRSGVAKIAPVGQSESVFICIETAAEVSIRDVKSLQFEKDAGTKLTAIRDRNPNAVTAKRSLGDKKWIIQSRLVSRFYSNDGAVSVFATGAVIMGFGGSTGRRLQQAGADGESGFNAEFQLAPLDNKYAYDDMSSTSKSGGVLGFLTIALLSTITAKLF